MKTFSLAALMTLAAICAAPMAHPQAQPAASDKAKPAAKPASQQQDKQSHQDQDDDGERIFEANCSRCHNTPDGFPPRISGTIVRHMRVRASLSAHDEQELLRFFNP
jgi:cytochrome c5